MLVMVTLLMVNNRLWERPGRQSLAPSVVLSNFSTVLTLMFCILTMYLLLAAIILIGALIVIDPAFMEQILGHPAVFQNYLDIAWLSAALGILAGALGSSFDDDRDVRDLTHAQRERRRIDEPSDG